MLGFLREMTLAATYGAGIVSDAFVIAMTIPGVVLALISGGFATLYIPQYSAVSSEDKNRFTSNILTLLLFVGLLFAIFFSLNPQILVTIFASNLVDESFGLAVMFLRIMVWSAIPTLLAGIFRAYLQIKNAFFIALISDGLINVFIIAATLAGKATGYLYILSIGSLIGNIASFLVLAWFGSRNGLHYKPVLDLRDKHLRSMFVLMIPIILSSAVGEINQIVDKNLASSLATGTVSALNYSVKINNVVISLVGSAIGVALFPRLSELATDNDIKTLKRHLVTCVKGLFPILFPITVGVILLAEPIIRILLERGAFNASDTKLTAECLQMYAVGLIALNYNVILSKIFYARRQSKWPAILSAISVAIGIILNLILIGPMKHKGLALATSTSSTLFFALMLIVLRKQLGALGFRTAAKELVKVVLASAFMGIAVVILSQRFQLINVSYQLCLFRTALTVAVGALVYFVLLVLMKTEWVWDILQRILPNALMLKVRKLGK
jgi:putative peptidoglycan lipid II flippase